MDPNAVLEEIREHLSELADPPYDYQVMAQAIILSEKVRTLDEWLSKGGFLPDAWQPRLNEQRAHPLVMIDLEKS